MKHLLTAILICAVLYILGPSLVHAQQPAAGFKPPEGIAHRTANIMSEGVRLSAEVFSPQEHAGRCLPTVILCHGWGGTAALLRREAVAFAKAGHLAITFDYRGWVPSDPRVTLTAAAPKKKKGNQFTARESELREVFDQSEQTPDFFNVIN